MFERWHDFAVLTGGASGALTGLLFVGVSITRDAVKRHPALRETAVQTLVLLISPLVVATFMLVPGTSERTLGGLLLLDGVLTGLVLVRTGRRKRGEDLEQFRRRPGAQGSRTLRVVRTRYPDLVMPVFTTAAGVSLLLTWGDGLYLIVPAVVVALLAGVVNAWFFLVGEATTGGPTTDAAS